FLRAPVLRTDRQRLVSDRLRNIELMIAFRTNVFVGRHITILLPVCRRSYRPDESRQASLMTQVGPWLSGCPDSSNLRYNSSSGRVERSPARRCDGVPPCARRFPGAAA